MGAGEMGVDRLGAGVEAAFVELFPDRDDLVFEPVRDPVGDRCGRQTAS